MRHSSLTPCQSFRESSRRAALRSISFTVVLLALAASFSAEGTEFRLEDATIADINNAFDAGILTSERLVQLYLNRIEAYDKQGPALNAIISLNPDALATARALDEERRISGARGPLHGIPVLLKDTSDVAGMPTTAGCLALADSYPPDDAAEVRRLKEAGAVILGKTNLCEFALWFNTESSLGGQTYNPYDDLPHTSGAFITPGGSSGGTGAAITANFATIGIGTDGGGSIRVPASFNSLVGLRPTVGLTSKDGIIPLNPLAGVSGPITRTVTDAALLLDVMAGYDPADPLTEASIGHVPESYTDSLDADGLQGARIGLMWRLPNRTAPHPEVESAVNAAVAQIEALGAEVVPFPQIPNITWMLDNVWYNNMAYYVDGYLAGLGDDAPVKSLHQIVASGEYLDRFHGSLISAIQSKTVPEEDPDYYRSIQIRDDLQSALLAAMDAHDLDAVLYPVATLPPPPIWGAFSATETGLNTQMAAFAGFPAIAIPGGFTSDRLPIGVELMARPFEEPTLIRFAYAYEQATHHRQPPNTTPPLPGETIPEPGIVLLGLAGTILLVGRRTHRRREW